MLFHQNINVVTDTCLGSGARTYNDRTESIYTEGFNRHRHHPATQHPSDRGQEPGVVHRHTRIIIDRFETFLNVPPNHCPPVKPLRGYPMHPHHNGPRFSPPTLHASTLQPAASSSEVVKTHTVSLQRPGPLSAPSITPAQLPDVPGTHVFEHQHEDNGFGEQVNEFLIQRPRTSPLPSDMQVFCSEKAFSQECTTPLATQVSRNRLGRPAIETLPNSDQPRPMTVPSAPQVSASENQFQLPHAPVAFPATVPRHQPSGQTPAECNGSATTKRPHAALVAGRQAPWEIMTLDEAEQNRRQKNDPCKLRKKAARQAARAKEEMAAANEMVTSNKTFTSNEMGTSNEIISANNMATENKMAAANNIAGADEKMTPNEMAAASNMPTADGQVDESVHEVPDNLKLEDAGHGDIFRFVDGKVDAGEWLE
ncbi:MAG: hypothetical protein L6R38_002799 [Xanthoria sp. 2 TBL-2021]|nr:MAG: hypothetical protein L6R38_002799 [Xanthoria sp. 2 TBL-2021]